MKLVDGDLLRLKRHPRPVVDEAMEGACESQRSIRFRPIEQCSVKLGFGLVIGVGLPIVD